MRKVVYRLFSVDQCANVSHMIRCAPESRSVLVAEASVAPVVRTSSSNSTVRPFMHARCFGGTVNAFVWLARRSLFLA